MSSHGAERVGVWCLFLEGHRSHHGGPAIATSSKPPETSSKSHLHTITLGIKALTRGFWGTKDKSIQSMAHAQCPDSCKCHATASPGLCPGGVCHGPCVPWARRTATSRPPHQRVSSQHPGSLWSPIYQSCCSCALQDQLPGDSGATVAPATREPSLQPVAAITSSLKMYKA